jgi:antitoxin VapB
MQKKRHVRLFRNGRNQAVRIPREWEFEGDEALIHREGDRLVIEPVRKGGLLALLAGLQPVDTPFPDVDDFGVPLDEPGLGR